MTGKFFDSYYLDSEAEQYGVNEAMVIDRLRGEVWLHRQRVRSIGRSWVPSSDIADEVFALSRRQIDRAMTRLIAAGVVERDRFPSHQFDRRYWYAFVDERRMVDDVLAAAKAETLRIIAARVRGVAP